MGTSILSILNTVFWVCLVFAIFFFLLSIVLFFVFDIKNIFSIKTGRAQAKTVKAMKDANESTGRLRVDGKTQTSKLSESHKLKGRAPAVVPPTQSEKNDYYQAPESVAGAENTTLLTPEGSEDTSLLSTMEVVQAQPVDYAETSLLTPEMIDDVVAPQRDPSEPKVELRIIKREIYIHTNEIIA